MRHSKIIHNELAKTKRALTIAAERANTAIKKLQLNRSDGEFLNIITAKPGWIGRYPCSHFALRTASARAMAIALLDQWASMQTHNRHDIWLGTFCFDDGITSVAIADVNLRRIKGKISKIMYEHKIHGIYAVEVEIVTGHVASSKAQLMFHVHMACWRTDGRKFLPKKTAKAMMDTARFPNALGARSVVFTKRNQTPKNIAGLAGYITKWPACVKLRRPNGRDGYNLVHDQAKYSPAKMLRMVEVLSHVSIPDMIGGIGDGVRVRKEWKRKFTQCVHDQTGKHPIKLKREDIANGWARIRAKHNLKGRPCQIKV